MHRNRPATSGELEQRETVFGKPVDVMVCSIGNLALQHVGKLT